MRSSGNTIDHEIKICFATYRTEVEVVLFDPNLLCL